MSKKIDKADLKGPDVFLSTSEKIFKVLERHIKVVLSVIAVVVAISLGYVVIGYMNSAREQGAADALYGPEAELKKADTDLREQREKLKTPKSAALPPVDYAKEFAPQVEKIKTQIKAHADTKAALVSALNLSYFLTQQKQFAEALAVLQIPTYHPNSSELLGGFWLMHRGVTLLENNQVDPALAAYKEVLGSEALKAFFPEALLKTGVCYELKGDSAKARETYEKVGREFPETEASATAQQYLRLLELNAHKQG